MTASAALTALAVLLGWATWLMLRARRVLRQWDEMTRAHYRMRRYAHRHDKQTGRAVPVRFDRGEHRDR